MDVTVRTTHVIGLFVFCVVYGVSVSLLRILHLKNLMEKSCVGHLFTHSLRLFTPCDFSLPRTLIDKNKDKNKRRKKKVKSYRVVYVSGNEDDEGSDECEPAIP